jgi:hypothetical protein
MQVPWHWTVRCSGYSASDTGKKDIDPGRYLAAYVTKEFDPYLKCGRFL